MTEPVARASARRSVRVAVALVAGQAVLCAVIGWVTIGPGGTHRPAGAVATVEPMAGKPLVIPTPGATPAPRPPRSSSAPARSSRAARSASASARPSVSRSSREPASPAATRKPATEPATVEQPGLALPTAVPSPQSVQSPVRLLSDCDPVGAPGLTADGVAVRCVEDADGSPSWQRDGRSPVTRSPAAG